MQFWQSCRLYSFCAAVAFVSIANTSENARGAGGEGITTLYEFKGGRDGARPSGTLVIDSKGVLGLPGAIYGTTEFGGGLCDGGQNTCGTVFRLIPPSIAGNRWNEEVLYRFRGGPDGENPQAGLALFKGALYGTTAKGGVQSNYCLGSCGTIFRIRPPAPGRTKWRHQIVYTFQDASDGFLPGALVPHDGVLYGMTYYGGGRPPGGHSGTLFQLVPASGKQPWAKTTIYDFTNYHPDLVPSGMNPVGITFDTSGRMVVPTTLGGTCPASDIFGCGTIYRLSPPPDGQTEWVGEVLWRFSGGEDGAYPTSPVLVNAVDVVYGTTTSGGPNGGGTLFGLGQTPASPTSISRSGPVDFLMRSFFGFPESSDNLPKHDWGFDPRMDENQLVPIFVAQADKSISTERFGQLIEFAGYFNRRLEIQEEVQKTKLGKTPGTPSGPTVSDPKQSGVHYGPTNDHAAHDVGAIYQLTAPPL
jgi:hypothetical protein